MSTTIEEGALEIEFDERWDVVIKWDDSSPYHKGIRTLKGSKAVDILALSRSRHQLLMIEFKDFRGHRIENRPRIATGALFDEVGHKVRDTVAGVRGAARSRDDAAISVLADTLASRLPLTVVLWLEEDPNARVTPRVHDRRQRTRSSTLTQELKKRVRWLTPRALVSSRTHAGLEGHGIEVRSRSVPEQTSE